MTHAPPTNQSELGPALPHIATVPSSPTPVIRHQLQMKIRMKTRITGCRPRVPTSWHPSSVGSSWARRIGLHEFRTFGRPADSLILSGVTLPLTTRLDVRSLFPSQRASPNAVTPCERGLERQRRQQAVTRARRADHVGERVDLKSTTSCGKCHASTSRMVIVWAKSTVSRFVTKQTCERACWSSEHSNGVSESTAIRVSRARLSLSGSLGTWLSGGG